MRPISKQEATGIFISIAVMAIALVFVRLSDAQFLAVPPGQGGSQGAVVIVGDEANEQAALANALYESAAADGTMHDLVIDDVQIGNGPSVVSGDSVTVHYIGSTQDGVKFDSSYDRGETFTFTVGAGRVIEGWERGIIGMQVGGQRILVIPPEMAYGNRQVGPISPNSTLVFVVELLEIR